MIYLSGIENFKIFNTKLDGETIVGFEVEYIPISMINDDEMANYSGFLP